ncbi:TetR/AcrR family transcriptional regulator [Pacificimonas sp. ICDLI1SI03]
MKKSARRELILAAARRLFAMHGYNSTTTQQIARAAGISEGLLYQHFTSKLALYRAVLKTLIREQNAIYNRVGLPEPSAAGLIAMVDRYLRDCLASESSGALQETRLRLASMAGEGSYAALIYRRAQRLARESVADALHAARNTQDLRDHAPSAENAVMFLEHVGTMITGVCSLPGTRQPYAKEPADLLSEALWYCCRGMGLRDGAIEQYLQNRGSTAR